MKYGKPKGFVQLSVQFKGASQGKAAYEFSCSDDGIGMGEEFQQHMFEPFAQEAPGARTVYEGSGTGLSIVKKLVEAMGGTISWTSAKGQGTTFRVTLLFVIDTACRIDRSDVGNVPDPLRGANVLLVEDNEMNMEIAECLLVDLGAPRDAGVGRAGSGRHFRRFKHRRVRYRVHGYHDAAQKRPGGHARHPRA